MYLKRIRGLIYHGTILHGLWFAWNSSKLRGWLEKKSVLCVVQTRWNVTTCGNDVKNTRISLFSHGISTPTHECSIFQSSRGSEGQNTSGSVCMDEPLFHLFRFGRIIKGPPVIVEINKLDQLGFNHWFRSMELGEWFVPLKSNAFTSFTNEQDGHVTAYLKLTSGGLASTMHAMWAVSILATPYTLTPLGVHTGGTAIKWRQRERWDQIWRGGVCQCCTTMAITLRTDPIRGKESDEHLRMSCYASLLLVDYASVVGRTLCSSHSKSWRLVIR